MTCRIREFYLNEIDAWRNGERGSPGLSSSGERYALDMRYRVRDLERQLDAHETTCEDCITRTLYLGILVLVNEKPGNLHWYAEAILEAGEVGRDELIKLEALGVSESEQVSLVQRLVARAISETAE